ncbi:hypothetical protein DPEC_G00341080 [Dallia pectoralis]|uniref:Uncharacterized protein n=1 Tax=Dallia pectoralis TaxID=75939 RepID=A0ACC2F598_DALPE|nr:hypothetical protein DPEC_G00341080 [Dallia pectoralis]
MQQEENSLDFKSLRAKFQEEEVMLLKQPRSKPVVPEKPKKLPPLHSPTNSPTPLSPKSHPAFPNLPAGAQPSLLSSLQEKGTIEPRFTFKEPKEKRGKVKDEAKVKPLGKKKTDAKDADRSQKFDPLDPKPRKETDLYTKSSKSKKTPLSLAGSKTGSDEPAAAAPTPLNTTIKKHRFLGTKKSSKPGKRGKGEDILFPSLDIASADLACQEPLAPLTTFGISAPPADALIPSHLFKPSPATHIALLPPSPVLKPSPVGRTNPGTVVLPPIPIPAPPTQPDPITNVAPAPLAVKTSAQTFPAQTLPAQTLPAQTITLPVSLPLTPSQVPAPPRDVPDQASLSGPPSHTPPPPEVKVPLASRSPQAEKRVQKPPLTPMSVLGRAEEMTTPKRKGSDIIFNALEKAKRKYASPIATTLEGATPEKSLPELPPIDYTDQTEMQRTTPPKPDQVNGTRQVSPFDGIAEEGAVDVIPALLVVPPPPPRKPPPEASFLGPPPMKPPRPPTTDQNIYDMEIPAPSEFSWPHGVSRFEDVQSGLESHTLQSAGSPEEEASVRRNRIHGRPEADQLQAAYIPETVLLENQPLNEGSALSEDFADREFPEPEQLDTFPASPYSQDQQTAAGEPADDGDYEGWDNAYEVLPAAKQKVKDQPTKKKKEAKNPYAESQSPTDEKAKAGRFSRKLASETPEEKELKKREKQRLEKEKKEQREQRERERKEQKEREKKESEIKKRFKITGQEEVMYRATVMEPSKGRKDDLSVNPGDVIGIIRTSNCPKGKWLARDSTNTYGYIALSQVELDIQEMMVIGKRATEAIKKDTNNGRSQREQPTTEQSGGTSGRYPPEQEDAGSFTDDSEEWACDDEEPCSYPGEEPAESGAHVRTVSMPAIGNKEEPSFWHQHALSETTTDGMDLQAKNEALHKLATFFQKPVVEEPVKRPKEPKPKEALTYKVDLQEPKPAQSNKVEAILELPDTVILPPPDLYADIVM